MAVEKIPGESSAPLGLLCEHASNRMPEGWDWPEADRWLIDTHWASDLGAAALTRELAGHFQAPAVLADFTRLLVDPNRPHHSSTLFREQADGKTVSLNDRLSPEERQRRITELYTCYHDSVETMVDATGAPILLSLHSFTPLYEGEPRTLEVGVLWERDDGLAEQFAVCLEEQQFVVARNEPYSGKDGYAYSVERHAARVGRRAIEIEVRQDLCIQAEVRRRVVASVERLLELSR